MKFWILITLLFVLSCSRDFSKFLNGKSSLPPTSTTTPTIQVIESGEIEQTLVFIPEPGQNLGSFQSYSFNCFYKISTNAPSTPCSNYGDHQPQIDGVAEKLIWDISSSTPNGIYEFIVNKNFSGGSLEYAFTLNLSLRAPFISKWQIRPDGVFTFKLNNTYSYNFIINWGDGSTPEHITSSGTITHNYTNGETEATITIRGDLPAFANDAIDPNNRNALIQLVADTYGMDFATTEAMLVSYSTPDLYNLIVLSGISLTPSPFNSKILEIQNLGDLNWQNLDNTFANQNLLTKVIGGNLTNVKSMISTFALAGYNFPNYTPVEFDTSTWNLINVESIKGLFKYLQFAPTSNLSGMKFSTKLLDNSHFLEFSIGDLSTATDWNFSEVTQMQSALYGAKISNLNSVNWNVRKNTNFESTFQNLECSSCNYSGIQITSSATNTSKMFSEYKGPSVINLAQINMSEVTNSEAMFENLDFTFFPDTTQVVLSAKNRNIASMFKDTENLVLDTTLWNTTNVENFSNLFSNVDMDLVNTSGIQVTNKATNLDSMFYRTTNLSLNTNAPGKIWNTSSVINMNSLFSVGHCKTTISCDFSRVIPSAATTSMSSAFYPLNEYIPMSNGDYLDISNFPPIDTSLWITTNVQNFSNLFSRKNMIGSNLSGLRVHSSATNIYGMFSQVSNLALNTTGWNLANVTDISEIFEKVDLSNVNLAGFNPTSALTTARWPFRNATNLTLNTSSWDISGLTIATDFFSMVDLTNVNLAGFRPGLAMQDFSSALYGTSNGYINTEHWNLPNSANIGSLFAGNSNNVIVLKNINLNAITSKNDLFGWRNGSYSHVILEGSTTDPGVLAGDPWLDDGGSGVWCENWAGATFAGFSCYKTTYPATN